MTSSSTRTLAAIELSVAAGIVLFGIRVNAQDVLIPSFHSWRSNTTATLAQIRTNHSGTLMTKWRNATMCQCFPEHADVHWFGYALSDDCIHVRAPGLPSYDMGPWFLD